MTGQLKVKMTFMRYYKSHFTDSPVTCEINRAYTCWGDNLQGIYAVGSSSCDTLVLSLRPVLRGAYVGQQEARGVTRTQQQDGEGRRILTAGGQTSYVKLTLYLTWCVFVRRASCEWCSMTAGCSTQSTSSWRVGGGIVLATVSLTSVMMPGLNCLL